MIKSKWIAVMTAAAMVFATACAATAADKPHAKKKTESTSSQSSSQPSSAAEEWGLKQLSATSQKIYKKFVADLQALKTTATATYTGSAANATKGFSQIVELIKTNHPELFWVSYGDQSCSASNGTITWRPAYYSQFTSNGKLDKAAVQKVQKQLDAKVKAVGKGASDYETVRNINSFLASNVKYSYDYSNFDVYEVTGSLAGTSSACEGFAKGFKYLCDELGVDCVVVTGTGILNGKTYEHAWDYVNLDGQWYLVDSTWNSLGSGTEKWFLLGTNSTVGGLSLLKSHAPDGLSNYPKLAANDYAA